MCIHFMRKSKHILVPQMVNLLNYSKLHLFLKKKNYLNYDRIQILNIIIYRYILFKCNRVIGKSKTLTLWTIRLFYILVLSIINKTVSVTKWEKSPNAFKNVFCRSLVDTLMPREIRKAAI